MNSYETRLNDLKQMTDQLDNKDLINEIETLAQKWAETYSLISKYSFHSISIFLLSLGFCCQRDKYSHNLPLISSS